MVGSTVNQATQDITHFRGDDHDYPFVITDPDGAVVDVTGWSFFFTVKKSLDDAIVDAKFQKTLVLGITITNAAAGAGTVSISASDVSALSGDYVYDLKVYDAAGKHHTTRRAKFIVPKNVTTDGTAGQPTAPGAPFPGWIQIGADAYFEDRNHAGDFYKVGVVDGALDVSGPEPTIPF